MSISNEGVVDVQREGYPHQEMHLVVGARSQTINYRDRTAVRLIITKFDETSNERVMILVHVANGDYFKLPGGGVEGGERHDETGRREAFEETGCVVDVQSDLIGRVEEWRDCHDLHQISFCYAANLIEETGKPELTKEEVRDGFQYQWVPVADALRRMQETASYGEMSRYVKQRDMFFVRAFLGQTKNRS